MEIISVTFLVLFALYFLPVIVALLRAHRQTLAIFFLTLLLGWTFIGWVVALVWSCTADVAPSVPFDVEAQQPFSFFKHLIVGILIIVFFGILVVVFSVKEGPAAHKDGAAAFTDVHYVRCYDGDTCTVTLTDVPALFGHEINVRLAGIDTPEIRAKCEAEKTLAYEARAFVREIMESAERIDLERVERGKYFRIVARIIADGQDVSALVLAAGLGVPYEGGKKNRPWCRSDSSQ